jgi:hypothetical protein
VSGCDPFIFLEKNMDQAKGRQGKKGDKQYFYTAYNKDSLLYLRSSKPNLYM